ncbi:MAG: phosphoribosyltransferase [Chloroflexi bacterium]|nr:phosphoribosyltransferase [Chloroflexota bacterium]
MLAKAPEYEDRLQAGQSLAKLLVKYQGKKDVIVLAISKGGVEVAFSLAQRLKAPMDIVISRLLRVPQQPETAFGAVTQDVVILNYALAAQWGIKRDAIRHLARDAQDEASDEMSVYRGARPVPELANKTVIIADDGMALGFPTISACNWVKRGNPRDVIVAVPVSPLFEVQRLRPLVDDVICPITYDTWGLRIGTFYRKWRIPTDAEIKALVESGGEVPGARLRKKTA